MNRKTMAILSYVFYFGIVLIIGLIIYFVASAIDKSSNKKVETDNEEVVVQPQIEVNRKKILLKVGESTRINARVIDGDNSELTFTSNNPSVVSVDNTGLVKGISVGSCIVSVRLSETVFVDVEVTVESNNVVATGVFVPDDYVKGVIGGNYQIVPTIIPKTATNFNVGYKSSDNTIATVDSNGLISFVLNGECTITVYLVDNPSIETKIVVSVRKY